MTAARLHVEALRGFVLATVDKGTLQEEVVKDGLATGQRFSECLLVDKLGWDRGEERLVFSDVRKWALEALAEGGLLEDALRVVRAAVFGYGLGLFDL